MTEHILVVEDDIDLGEQVVEHLEEAGFVTTWLKNGDEARDIDIGQFVLVILDLMLPGTYGLDVLKRYREQSDVPVLILTARNETPDKVRALGLGADDYITKPFWPDELMARVKARLRRPMLMRGDEVKVGTLRIDREKRVAHLGEEALALTPVEFQVLDVLARRKDSAVTRRALVEAALDPEREGAERTLDVHISRLRKKLGSAGPTIDTVWGIGYRLSAASDHDGGDPPPSGDPE